MDVGTKRTLVVGLVLIAAVAVLALLFAQARPDADQELKHIEVTVTTRDKDAQVYSISTEEAFLGDALLAEELVTGEEGEYGLFITSVAGETADEAKEEWWCLTKDGQSVQTGVDSTPIADGDHFELTLMVGYGS